MAESMRARWGRVDEPIALSLTDLTDLIQPAFPNQVVLRGTPTSGGLANTNLRLDLSARPQPVLLRLCTRPRASFEPEAPFAKEAALHRLLAPRLPVPTIFYAASTNPITGHPYLLREWLDGERLEVVAHDLNSADLADLAADVGTVLAGIHSFTFPDQGFLDKSLAVTPFPPAIGGGGGLAEFLNYLLGDLGKTRLGTDLANRLMDFAEREQGFGAAWSGPPCLVHADFGGSNILVRHAKPVARARESERGVSVTGVVDWEFAFSGSPFIDFGNLLRPPLGQLIGFADGVARGYRGAGGRLPDDWHKRSVYADLGAWAEMLGRPRITAAHADDARGMIAHTLAAWQSVPQK